jgi:AcrR family transcriptional regulator
MAEPVKGKSEAGRRREERAHQTRQRIVDAAIGLFVERGYVATTVGAIAVEAGVAPATVYQAFGTKQAILARALDVTVAGDTKPVALLDRTWVTRARAEPDGAGRLAIVVRHAAQVAARTAAIKQVMSDAAASEPNVRELIRVDTERRYITQQALIDLVIEARPLRPGMDRDNATATFFAVVNSETYRLLVEHLGWSTNQWQRWLADVLKRQLFELDALLPRERRPRHRQPADPRAP